MEGHPVWRTPKKTTTTKKLAVLLTLFLLHRKKQRALLTLKQITFVRKRSNFSGPVLLKKPKRKRTLVFERFLRDILSALTFMQNFTLILNRANTELEATLA